MTAIELLAEAHGYELRLQGHMSDLAKLGVLTGFAHLGQTQPAAGLANIRKTGERMWEPDEQGELAMIIPVPVPTMIEPFGIPIETVEIIDLIAFSSRSPASWYWRTGTAWALGEHLLGDLQDSSGDRISIVSTPLSWLRAAGRAVCILDWSKNSPAWAALRQQSDLLAETPHLARRLERAIHNSVRLPRVEVSHAA